MSWFYSTFLPSLFDRAGVNAPMWLSRKQTDVCTRYMAKEACVVRDCTGDAAGTHLSYTTTWAGRSVRLEYSKRNGCGAIVFSATATEQELAATRAANARDARDRNTYTRMYQKRPDMFTAELMHVCFALDGCMLDLAAELQEPTPSQSNVNATADTIRALKIKLDLMQSCMF